MSIHGDEPHPASKNPERVVAIGDDGEPTGSFVGLCGSSGRRPRAPDYAAENGALLALAQVLASDPGNVFRHLARAASELTGSRSAGVTFTEIENGGPILRRAGLAGATTLRQSASGGSSPCTQAILKNETLHLLDSASAFAGWNEGDPGLGEMLLVPVPARANPPGAPEDAAETGAVGVLWVAGPRPGESFDAEDARCLASLAVFASAAHQIVQRPARPRVLIEDSEDRYRTLLESIDEGFCVIEMLFDEDGNVLDYLFLEANASFERQTGLRDVVGRSMREILPTIEPFWYETFGRIALTGEPTRIEAKADALGHWYDLYAFRTGDPDQHRVAVLFNDIVGRKRAEAVIRASEEQFRRFGEASSNILWIRDAATLDLRYVTPAFNAIYGLGPKTPPLAGQIDDWLRLVVPEDRAKAREHNHQVSKGESVSFVHRIRRASDGAIRWLRNTDFPIPNEAGDVAFIGGISEDMTELREAELRLETLIQGIPQLVWRTGEVGDWTWCNPQWTDFTGLSQDQSTGFGWLEALYPQDREAAVAFWKQAGRTGQLEMEGRIRGHRDGEYRWFQTRATPVRDQDGSIVEWLGTSTDIDDLRRLQERQKVLVAELQHRTRNLLGMIRSLADRTMQTSGDLKDFKTRFKNRLGALARVQGLLSRLSDHDRVTFDQLIEVELAAVYGAVDRVMLAGPRGVRLRSATVQTLALAIHELATNAMKHGALGQPDGRLSVAWHCEPGATARDKPWLHIVWDESNVAMPDAGRAAIGTGQGRELIERALPYQFGARTLYEIKPDGIRCTIALPVSHGN